MIREICVLGDAAVDLIVHLPENRHGERVMAHVPALYPGGSGANTAVALARLGISTQFIGKIGNDHYGQIIRKDFSNENVGVDQLITDIQLSTICVFAFIDQDGERYLWEWPRDHKAYTSISFDEINLHDIKKAGWLHITGLLLSKESNGRKTALDILTWAKSNGIISSLDLNLRVNENTIDCRYREILLSAISNSDYILGSREEFALLDDSHDWQNLAKNLANFGKVVVVRNGKGGSILLSKYQRLSSIGFHVDVVDTVGAGDVFNAGFIAALLKNHDFATALQWGNAVAGYTISKEGARACPSLEELKYFLVSST